MQSIDVSNGYGLQERESWLNFWHRQVIFFGRVTATFQANSPHCLTLRLLMSYIYGAHILDVSRSHTTTQHSR